MISLQQLIKVAPFPEDTKKELLGSADTFSDSKKLQLEDLCWAFISQYYQNELNARQENAVFEAAKGDKSYSPEDFAKIKEDVFSEVVRKFDLEEDEEDLEGVRKKLASFN